MLSVLFVLISRKLTHLSPRARRANSSASPQPSCAVRLWSSHSPFPRSFISISFWTGTGMRGNKVPYHSNFSKKLLTICPIVIVQPPPALGSISWKIQYTEEKIYDWVWFTARSEVLNENNCLNKISGIKSKNLDLVTLTLKRLPSDWRSTYEVYKQIGSSAYALLRCNHTTSFSRQKTNLVSEDFGRCCASNIRASSSRQFGIINWVDNVIGHR